MKKVLVSVWVAALCFSVMGFVWLEKNAPTEEEKVTWYTFQQAVELSKKKPKKIFIDIYTGWCGWCKVMDANTFTHPIIAKDLNKYYYPVKMDAEMKDSILFGGHLFVNPDPARRNSVHQLAAALLDNKMSYPTTVYLDEGFNMLSPVPGYMKPQDIEPILVFYGENHHKTTKWEDFQKSFRGEVDVEVAPVTPPLKPH